MAHPYELDEFGLPKMPKFAVCRGCGEEFVWFVGPHGRCDACRRKTIPGRGVNANRAKPRSIPCKFCGKDIPHFYGDSFFCSLSCVSKYFSQRRKAT